MLARSGRVTGALCGLLGILVACSSAARLTARNTPARAAAAPALSGLDYVVSIDAALSQASVRLCWHGGAPASLVYGSASAAAYLRAPRVLHASSEVPLRVVDGHIVLEGVAADSCIAYEVDLAAALERDALLLAYPGQGSLVLASELLLWRPVHRPVGLIARARFELAPGMQVSLPWAREDDGVYRVDESAFAFTSHLVLGHFQRERLHVGGGEIDVIVLNGFPSETPPLLAAWIESAAQMVSLATGNFPARTAQVIVVPTAASSAPIHFGYTGRGGAPSIVLFVPTDASRESLRSDWIAIHEMSHLLLPFVSREDAWLSEGIATYLQEVLRVRAGQLAPQEAWRRIYEGSLLGRSAQGTLQDETRRMAVANNYARVYWAGAAMALLADVALRERSHGQASLDSVLMGLAARPRDAARPYSAAALIREMDTLAGVAVFGPIAARYLRGPAFPDLGELYAKLGVRADGSAEQGPQTASLAWVRDAIMLHLAQP